MIALDADVLIYAAKTEHPYSERLRALLSADVAERRVGSVFLIPEVLTKPSRAGGNFGELDELSLVLEHIDLLPLDENTARLATVLGAKHGLRAPDATHLATAIAAGADYFLTNNRKDFPKSITEIDVIYPDDLPLAA